MLKRLVVIFAAVVASIASVPPSSEELELGPVPIELSNPQFTENSIGSPEVRVEITNVTEAILNTVALTFSPFNGGDAAKQFGSGDTTQGVEQDDDLPPGETRGFGFELIGWETSELVVVSYRSASFVDEEDEKDWALSCLDTEGQPPKCPSVVVCSASETNCEDPRPKE